MKLYCLRAAAIGALCAVAANSVYADDRLMVSGPEGQLAGIGIADISKITFDGNNITIATTVGDKVYDLAEISKITFDLSTSVVDNIEAALDDINVSVSGGVLTVSASADVPLTLNVYNLRGILVSSQQGTESLSVDFNSMASGLYIVKANNKTIKFTR